MINTPRDYYVQVHGTTGLKDKLTHAGVYGIKVKRRCRIGIFHSSPLFILKYCTNQDQCSAKSLATHQSTEFARNAPPASHQHRIDSIHLDLSKSPPIQLETRL